MAGALAIIVPYRDRRDHLDRFVDHMRGHLAQDPRRPERVILKIVEQEPGRDFNRGLLLNIGFALTHDQTACTVFHDVDYLPLSADYGPLRTGWAHLVGAGGPPPMDPRGFPLTHDAETFVGGVTLFANPAFAKINGYANAYWGWGYEDVDIRMRAWLGRLPFERRPGRYEVLPHLNAGFEVEGRVIVQSRAGRRNDALVRSRFPPGATAAVIRDICGQTQDGLSSLRYRILARRTLPGAKGLEIEQVTVAVPDVAI